jgi:hypothetical protein
MGTIQLVILLIGTFVVPAVVILGDNEQFSSRNSPAPAVPR